MRWTVLATVLCAACSNVDDEPLSADSGGGVPEQDIAAWASPAGSPYGGGSHGDGASNPGTDSGNTLPPSDALAWADASDGAGVITPADTGSWPTTDTATGDSGIAPLFDAVTADIGAPPVDDATQTTDATGGGDANVSGTKLPTCGEDKVVLDEPIAPASVLILMDRSGSMEGDNWVQTQAAVGKVLELHGATTHFGLLMFPQKGSSCSLAALPDVPFALNNGQPIVDKMADTGTGGNTPTGGALLAAHQIFNQTPTDGQKLVIVATDGSPNCAMDCQACGCAFGCDFFCFNEDTCAEGEVFDAVKALTSAGIKTYVVGIAGSSGAKAVLNKMADLGGTALPGDVKYYETTSGEGLAAALDSIAGSVASCNVKLQIPPGTAFLVVEIDGQPAAHDTTHVDGWDLLEGDVLQLYGPACDAASSGDADVTVTYVCKYSN